MSNEKDDGLVAKANEVFRSLGKWAEVSDYSVSRAV